MLIVGRLSPESKGVRGESFAAGQGYFRAVERAGGVPLMLPPIPALHDRLAELIDRVDAIVMHGGGDVDPRRYGQEPSAEELYGIVPEHDEVELDVVRLALEADKPMLAICRGMQVLNVSQGGTLVQDLESCGETGEGHWMNEHPVDIVDGSKLADAVGTTHLRHCYSVHHQGLDRLGEGIVPVAHDEHGLIEAVEYEGASWVVGVQWHPEDTIGVEAGQLGLFQEFIRRSTAHAAG